LFEEFMTNQFDSEQELFDAEEKSELATKNHRKRNSLGFRLPILTKGQQSSSNKMPDTKDTKGKGKDASGTGDQTSPGGGNGKGQVSILGVPGFTLKTQGGTVFVGTDDKGKEFEIDAYNSVFAGAFPSSKLLEKFLNYLEYSAAVNFAAFIEGISYQGFDREVYIQAALLKVSVSVFCRFAILGAVRGSNFKKIEENCLLMPSDLSLLVNNGTVIKKAKKRDDLTILRFTASIPHWVAFWLFKVGFPKKIDNIECPGWLQFPGAASLPMSKPLRLQHIEFCKAFSALLPGGTFNGNIYYTAYSNPIPEKDIPSMVKTGLGIGEEKQPTISSDDVRSAVTMQMVKAA
jgi:hypothetical protein